MIEIVYKLCTTMLLSLPNLIIILSKAFKDQNKGKYLVLKQNQHTYNYFNFAFYSSIIN